MKNKKQRSTSEHGEHGEATAEHTPTPWQWVRTKKNMLVDIFSPDKGTSLGGMESRTTVATVTYITDEDAAFIVRAVNSIETYRKYFRAFHREYWGARTKKDHDIMCCACPAISLAEKGE